MIAIFGVSGAGKTYLIRSAIQSGLTWKRIAALTTRPKRYGVDERQERIFLNDNEFDRKLRAGELCLVNQVYGYRYAYYRKELFDNKIIIETHHREYKELCDIAGQFISIYIKPKSLEAAYDYIRARNSAEKDKWDEICEESRTLNGMMEKGCFNYVLVNDYTESSKKMFLDIANGI